MEGRDLANGDGVAPSIAKGLRERVRELLSSSGPCLRSPSLPRKFRIQARGWTRAPRISGSVGAVASERVSSSGARQTSRRM